MNVSSIPATSDTGSMSGGAFTDAALGLGKDAFMKMLLAQIQNQNPLEPMKNNDFIAQLAQFSSLEAMQNMQATLKGQAVSSSLSDGAALIGREIKIHGPDGEELFGAVDGVEQLDSEVFLRVGQTLVKMSQVLEIN